MDPTGAGDSFAGAMMGYLAAEDSAGTDTVRRAIAYGTVMAGIELEDFSLNRLFRTSRQELDARMSEFEQITRF